MNLRDHYVITLSQDEVRMEFLRRKSREPAQMTIVKSRDALPTLFGVKQGSLFIIVSETGKGKTEAALSMPANFDILMLGETFYDEDSKSKITGVPANLDNLINGLNKTKGLAIIDSFSSLHPGSMRLADKGIDLSLFELLSELDYYAANNNLLICGVYNPLDPNKLKPALQELEGRLRIVVKLEDNFKARVMNPLTREYSQPISNRDVYKYMSSDWVNDDRRKHQSLAFHNKYF